MLNTYSMFEDYKIAFTRYISCLDIIYYPTNNIITLGVIFIILCIFFNKLIKNNDSTNNNFIFLLFWYIYEIVCDLVIKYLGKEHLRVVPFFLFLFMTIFFSNLLGILPFVFTETSHITFTFLLASIVWFSILVKGILVQGIFFFKMFTPKGVPTAVLPLLIFIESLSYFFRWISLGLRLFANIFAGHVLLETISLAIFGVFLKYMSSAIEISNIIFIIVAFILLFMLFSFELIVAFLQSYIFILLSILYLSEVYTDAH